MKDPLIFFLFFFYLANTVPSAAVQPSSLNSVIVFQEKLNTILLKEPIGSCLAPLERATQIRRENLMFGLLIVLLAIYLVFGYGRDSVCNFVIGLFYPVYASIMSVELDRTNSNLVWLIYWPIYTLFMLMEHFCSHLFNPPSFYCLFKCALLIWLMLPGAQGGAYIIYQRVLLKLIPTIQNKLKKEA